jgi:predicted nucleotidyltransferase
MVDLTQSQIDLLKEILQRLCPEIEVYAFGSRTKGSARPYSDLDLLLVGKQPLDWKKIEAIKQVLSESDLPFLVDVVDWHTLDEPFKKQIGNRVKIC